MKRTTLLLAGALALALATAALAQDDPEEAMRTLGRAERRVAELEEMILAELPKEDRLSVRRLDARIADVKGSYDGLCSKAERNEAIEWIQANTDEFRRLVHSGIAPKSRDCRQRLIHLTRLRSKRDVNLYGDAALYGEESQ